MNLSYSIRHLPALVLALALLVPVTRVRAEQPLILPLNPPLPPQTLILPPTLRPTPVPATITPPPSRLGRLQSIRWTEMFKQASPRYLYNQARTNWREGRFYSTDLEGPGPGGTHPTWQAAMKRSLAPIDMRANVRATVMSRVHPFKIAGNLIDPIGIELQRQIASGEGLDFKRLATALHPTLILTTMVAGTAGDIAGAVVQSSLARFGPVGAAVGFFARPMIGFAGSLVGMNVGESMVKGKSLKGAMAEALRTFKPGRDGGQLVGGVIGGTLGQVFIPIPIVGGIVGGIIGGTIGAVVGNTLARVWPFNKIEKGITGWLNRMADKIDGTDRKAKPAPPPPPTSGDRAPVLGGTTASTSSAPASAVSSEPPRVAPVTAFANPLSSGEPRAERDPSFSELPVASR